MPDQQAIESAIEKLSDDYLKQLSLSGWWHSIELGDGHVTEGVVSLADLKTNYARFQLPDDLRGKTVLDIGCWDGFYTFEAESHGATVTALDCFHPETFFAARAARQSQAKFHELNVYELSRDQYGQFDIVFFQGVLYHLQHPLLGLQRVCEVTRDIALVGSHIVDHLNEPRISLMQFYPNDELGGQYDNWWGPSSQCLSDMALAAGFVRTELLYRDTIFALFKAYRRWEHPPLADRPTLTIREIANAVRLDRQFERRGRFALLSIWVEGLAASAEREDVRVEIGEFGAVPIYVIPPQPEASTGTRVNRLTPVTNGLDESLWQAARQFTQIVVAVPPGLLPGAANVRVYHHAEWSTDFEITLRDGAYW